MRRFYLYTALASLVITLLSGLLLRAQWGWGFLWVEEIKYLIHAHSHLAMLGWLFWVIVSLMIDKQHENLLPRWFGILFLMLSLLLFPAFLYQGYGPISIALSTLHIFFSYYLAWRWFKIDRNAITFDRQLLRHALILMLVSTIGPLALGGSTVMGPEWMEFWIRYYLHGQFNGWITFAVLALLIRYTGAKVSLPAWMLDTWTVSAVLSVIVLIDQVQIPGLIWIGRLAALIYMIIGLVVGFKIITSRSSEIIVSPLLLTGLIWFAVKQIMFGLAIFPEYQILIETVHNARVAFTHVSLLGFSSALLLWMIQKENGVRSLPSEWLIALGSALMCGLLLAEGSGMEIYHLAGWSIQRWYVVAGGFVLLGVFELLRKLTPHRATE